MKHHYSIKLPDPKIAAELAQNEAYFLLGDATGGSRRVRFHDYADIYAHPGLYEQLFHRHLRCASPRKVVGLLDQMLTSFGEDFGGLNVLDVGAGNGMVGAELISRGANRVVGIDIIPEARAAAERDRPGVYDDYLVADLVNLPPKIEAKLKECQSNCLISIAALGFGDIPPAAFLKAMSLTAPHSWIAFNLKDSFFGHSDATGFSTLIKKLMAESYIQIFHLERYRHRLSNTGEPLYYYAFIGRKTREVPLDFMNNA